MNFAAQSKGTLIVSCQAVDDEPLNDPLVMQKIAKAVVQGGTKILRLSQIEHIQAIQKVVDVPIIGLVKKHYSNSEVFITPTLKEAEALIKLKVDVVALDATNRKRPAEDLKQIVQTIKSKYPQQLLMADCSTLEDAMKAQVLGFDFVATTLRGYTLETKGESNLANDYAFIKALLKKNLSIPVIVEGGIWEPKQVKDLLKLGVHAVIVGSAITRPQKIVEHWLEEVFGNEKGDNASFEKKSKTGIKN